MSFNVNGLRARLPQLQSVLEEHTPDVIGLQETKVSDEEFPVDAIRELGYQCYFHGQKGHYGVALLSKSPALSVSRGFPEDREDAQKRLIHGKFGTESNAIHILNGYFPQGENRDHPSKFPAKQKFYADLSDYLQAFFKQGDKVIILGDMNVAPEDIDVGIKPDNAKRWLKTGKCAFLPEERDWLSGLCNWGLIDTFRHKNGENVQSFSWFDYRSRGFEQEPKRGLRIDLILASEPLLGALQGAGIDYKAREAVKPSDHCPIWADFRF